MKKITKIFSVLLMVTLIAFASTACSGGGSGVAGKTYKFDSFSTGDDEADELMSSIMSLIDEYTISFKNDGTCTMKMSASGDLSSFLGESSDTQDGTYEEKEGVVKIKFDDETQEFKIDGNKLIIEEDGMEMVFVCK